MIARQKFAWLAAVLLGALAASPPLGAQQPVTIAPQKLTNTAASGTIAVTNTFQSVLDAVTQDVNQPSKQRYGCLVINNGTDLMWVFFGDIADATTPKSIPMRPHTDTRPVESVSCGAGNGSSGSGVIQDQVSVTGTAGDFFSVQSQ